MKRVHPAWLAYFDFGRLSASWLGGGTAATLEPLTEARLARLFVLAEKNGAASALAWLLHDHVLPGAFRARVDDILSDARRRAEQRMAGIEIVAEALNAIGVRPLLLKGSAGQFGGAYPDPAFRTMCDIDLLVPRDRFAACVGAAERAGFVNTYDGDYGHSHAPQHHAALDVAVEIHWQIARTHLRDNFPVGPLFAGARAAKAGNAEVLLPDWTQHAVLTILHTLAWDRTRYMAFVPLKPMLDLAALKASGVPVDWPAVGVALDRAGETASLVHVETLFRAFFGMPLTGRAVPEATARRILLYYRIGAVYPIVVALARIRIDLGDRLKVLYRRPALIVRLLTPALYARLTQRIVLAFRES